MYLPSKYNLLFVVIAVDSGIITTSSGGKVVFETPSGRFFIDWKDLRALLFFGQQVPLQQEGRILDSDAIVMPSRGAMGVLVLLPGCSFHVTRRVFVAVAKGDIGRAEMTPIPTMGGILL